MKKIIITGGPGVGKTTTLQLLKENGVHIIDECARDIIESEQKKQQADPSYKPIVPWLCFDEFQVLNMQEQIQREEATPSNAHTVLLDRSLVDVLGYHKIAGKQPPKELMSLIKNAGYAKKVIFLDVLNTYVNDGVRKEDPEKARQIHTAILEAYQELGFDVVVIPPVDPQSRAVLVKKHLQD